jgi:hypothetical protein
MSTTSWLVMNSKMPSLAAIIHLWIEEDNKHVSADKVWM